MVTGRSPGASPRGAQEPVPTPSIRARIADVFVVEGVTDLDGWRQRLNHMFYVFIAVMLPTVIVTNFPIYLREGFYGLMVAVSYTHLRAHET